jgi:hypothetical protein
VQPADIEVVFGTPVSELPAGTYILYEDSTTEGLNYISIDGTIEGQLFRFDPPYSVYRFAVGGPLSSRIAGLFDLDEPAAYVVDLERREAFKLAPLCWGNVWPSPGVQWMANLCSPLELEGEIIIEAVSLSNGRAQHLQVPFEGDRLFTMDLVRWVTDDLLIAPLASFESLVGRSEVRCLVSLKMLGMRCVPGPDYWEIRAISPQWLVVNQPRRSFDTAQVITMECFLTDPACEPVAVFDRNDVWMTRYYWSPDNNYLATEAADWASPTHPLRVGYYEVDTWTYHELAFLPTGHEFLDWCPDSSCMVVVGPTDYVAYLDGRLEPLPFELRGALQVIELP